MIGVTLLVAVVVMLAVVATMSLSSLAESGTDASAVHGMGAYSIGVPDDGDGERLVIEPQAVNTRSSTYNLRINGRDVYEWDGKEKLELTCLYPTDRISVYTEKGETTNLVAEYDVETALDCKLGFVERFEYAFVHEDGTETKVDMKSEYAFGLAMDPDGPGEDSGTDAEIGPISFANDWHYSKKYNKDLEGFEGPVWVFILVDNVHAGGAGDLNWTDAPPAGTDPGEGNYEIDGDQVEPEPYGGSGEPTNDVYIVFEPGCDKSRMKIVGIEAGYENSILMDGTVIADDVNNANQDTHIDTIYDAPGIPC